MAFWFAGVSDVRMLRFDKNRSSRFFDCLTKFYGKALVPTAPQSRPVWSYLETRLLVGVNVVVEILDEDCFVFPPVEFFEYESAELLFHFVPSRRGIPVMRAKVVIGQRKLTKGIFYRVVSLEFEPYARYNPNIILGSTQ